MRLLTVGGVTKTASEWAEEKGMKPDTIYMRLKYGWSDEKAVNTPTMAPFGGRNAKPVAQQSPAQPPTVGA